jgi:6-phosphofructo-2-kinase/fructose-2,6-biphosphatase 2
MSVEEAIEDFYNRIKKYESVYETLSDDYDSEKSFIKIINIGKRIVLNNIKGYIPSKISSLLLNYSILPNKIYLSRHGESTYNKLGKIGGDS